MDRRRFALLAASSAAYLAVTPVLADAPAAPVAPATDPKAAEVARKVQAFYDQAKTYVANFKQRYTIYAYNRTKDSSGTVKFAKPGKMRWMYTNNGNVVVSDGKEIKIYEHDNKQMYLQKVDKTQYPAALSFLMGNGSLLDAFSMKLLDSKELQFPSGFVLLGTPKDPTPAYQKLLFYVDGKTYQVRRVLLIDAQKNRNRFDFSSARVNEPLKNESFTFSPPPGTHIIKP